jgi:predicted acyl esterase
MNKAVRNVLGVVLLLALLPAPVRAATVTQSLQFRASDGALLHADIAGDGDLHARPLIVEFTPYGPACCGVSFGPAYNSVQVHVRGTGLSTGTWSAVGPRDQQDVSEFLAWACHQPWSNGHIGLYGFSASAIAVYNSMHLPLACVDAAALMAGTADLYRDLLDPGGIPNIAPGAVVATGVGAPLIAAGLGNLLAGRNPLPALQSGIGFMGTIVQVLAHTTEDQFWLDHTQRAGPNTFPVLADTSFYDPEARGPFESFKLLRATNPGTHLLVFGAHDGYPAGTPGPFPQYQRWFDHYLLGVDNGIEHDPAVQLLVGNGSREQLAAGNLTHVNASDWPVPGTRWQRLYLDASRAGTALSLNDGSLRGTPPAARTTQLYPAVSSLATATDPHTTSTLAGFGAGPLSFGALFNLVPELTQMNLAEPISLTYTTAPFTAPVDVVGPASLDVFVATALPESDLHVVLADQWPDGRSYAVGVGRLRTSFPDIDVSRSVVDPHGEVVQPYGDYSVKHSALPGQTREYHVEFWPIGNRFAVGHRLRIYIIGTSLFMLPALPGLNAVSLGGATPSRLLLPVLPGSDACSAIGAGPSCS